MSAAMLTALLALAGRAQAAPAAVRNASFQQDPQGLVHLRYRLELAAVERCEATFKISDDGGKTFGLVPVTLRGDFGPVSGTGEKEAVWDVEKDSPVLACDACLVAVECRRFAAKTGLRQGNEMVRIPAGWFWMGSTASEGSADERPQHKVFLDAFDMDKYLVIVAQYRQFGAAAGRPMMSQPGNGDDLPVVYVSWDDAVAYCEWAGKRLPTEAQWEKAARGRVQTLYSFGDKETELGEYAWFSNNSGGHSHPVGRKRSNQYDLFDMHGNVAQWVADWYHEGYDSEPQKNPAGPASGENRVLRGGSWSSPADKCRAASRDWYFPQGKSETNGFRCAAPVVRP